MSNFKLTGPFLAYKQQLNDLSSDFVDQCLESTNRPIDMDEVQKIKDKLKQKMEE